MDPDEYNKRGRATSSAYGLQKRLQFLGAGRVPQLPQRLGFDLPDPLARYVERASDFLERVLRAVADSEAHLQDLLLAGGQRLQHPPRLVLKVRHEDRVDRRKDLPVLDEIAQMRILFLPDRRFERNRLLRDLHDLADL